MAPLPPLAAPPTGIAVYIRAILENPETRASRSLTLPPCRSGSRSHSAAIARAPRRSGAPRTPPSLRVGRTRSAPPRLSPRGHTACSLSDGRSDSGSGSASRSAPARPESTRARPPPHCQRTRHCSAARPTTRPRPPNTRSRVPRAARSCSPLWMARALRSRSSGTDSDFERTPTLLHVRIRTLGLV